jgi:MFS family permease
MARPSSSTAPTRREPVPPLAVLIGATAVGSAGLAAGGTAGSVLGAELTGSEGAAGLPLGLLVLGSAAAAPLIARLSSWRGRLAGLVTGYLLGTAGAVVVIVAAARGSFPAVLAGSALLGAANASVFLSRYAAAAGTGPAAGGRALGAVLLATAVGAVAGPVLLGPAGGLASAVGLPRLTGLYLLAVPAFAGAAAVLALAPRPGAGSRVPVADSVPALVAGAGSRLGGLRNRPARTAVGVLALANLVMVGVMAITPVHLTTHGHGLGFVGMLIAAHVVGMFGPSLFSGWLADRHGPLLVIALGFATLALAGGLGVIAAEGATVPVTLMLVVLGVGWNFGVVGGSALLADSVHLSLRPRVEGVGEVAMGLAAAGGAPAAGLLAAHGGFPLLSAAGGVIAVVALAGIWPAAAAGR